MFLAKINRSPFSLGSVYFLMYQRKTSTISNAPQNFWHRVTDITSFEKRLGSYLGHTLNFCPNLVQCRFRIMYHKESLTLSSTVILSYKLLAKMNISPFSLGSVYFLMYQRKLNKTSTLFNFWNVPQNVWHRVTDITSFWKRLESSSGHTLNFCPNLVQYRFRIMYHKESLTLSSTVILSTNFGGSKTKRILSRRARK